MATARKRTIPRVQAPVRLTEHVEEYLQNRSMRERSAYHEDRIKRDLLQVLEAAGEPVDKHKKTLDLDRPLGFTQYKAGKPVQKKVTGIERRERVTKSLDEEKTLALLKVKGLLDECTTTIVVINEDAILAANYDERVTDEELADLYAETITPAFYLTEETS